MAKETKPEVKPNYCLIKIDERDMWNPEIAEQTKAMYGVYAFDRNSHTHCCELTPSYCLVFISNDYEEIDGLSEDQREALNEKILGSMYDCEQVTYMHVSSVERMIEKHPELLREVTNLLDLDEDDEDEDRTWNAVYDHIAERWGSGSLMY